MKQAVPYLGRFLSKLFFEIIPGALVSVLAAYFLNVLHLAQGAEPVVVEPPSVTQSDGLSGDQRRELTRQMLRERRENPEEPAEVKPMPSLRPTVPPDETADIAPAEAAPAAPPAAATAPPPAAPVVAVAPEPKPLDVKPFEAKSPDAKPLEAKLPEAKTPEVKAPEVAKAPEAKPLEAKPRPESTRPAVATAPPLPRIPAPRPRSEPAAVAAVAPPAAPAVTGALPAAPAPGAPSTATQLPPVTVNTPPPDAAAEPPRRGIVGNVFSGISTFAGGAANVTGNTVNWVIDLPGKAISAGGKLLGVNSAPPPPAPAPTAAPPAAGPAPTTAPAPAVDPQRRNYL
jgi:hypothetical protein